MSKDKEASVAGVEEQQGEHGRWPNPAGLGHRPEVLLQGLWEAKGEESVLAMVCVLENSLWLLHEDRL